MPDGSVPIAERPAAPPRAVPRASPSLKPYILGFILLAVVAACAIALSIRQQRAVVLVRHTLEVEKQLDVVRSLALQAEASQRGYMISGATRYIPPYRTAADALPHEIDVLARLVPDNPVQVRNVQLLRAQAESKRADLARRTALQVAGNRAAAIAIVANPDRQGTLLRLNAAVARVRAEEERLYRARIGDAAWLTTAEQAALGASVLLVIVMAVWSLRDARRRIGALAASNARLADEIAERDRVETQLRQLQKMESLGQLTGGVAHDFNNMLAVVIGSLDMGRRRLTGGEHPRLAENITNALDAAQRAAVLTARLLAFSRQQPLEPKPLDGNKLVAGVSEMLRRTIGESVRLETVLAGGLWRVCVDPAQLESAIVNLAVNARDAMPEGGRLTIETANANLDERYARQHADVAPGQYVLVSVTDTGTGMPPEVRDRAFDPFYTTKDVGRGTGLGLSQVFGFVKQSGGHIAIYSEVGHGTTVKIYLPRDHSNATLTERAPAAAPPRGNADEVILVVEDETQVRHMTVDALRELGYTVVQAAGGPQALEQLALQPHIHLLFTDIVMPEMGGRQLADRAVALRPGLKVLYTTGYTRNAVVHNGVVDAGLAFLPKPFELDALAHKVRDVLDG